MNPPLPASTNSARASIEDVEEDADEDDEEEEEEEDDDDDYAADAAAGVSSSARTGARGTCPLLVKSGPAMTSSLDSSVDKRA